MGIVLLAVIKISLVALLGFYLYRKNFVKESSLRFLIFFVINFAFPFLIFSNLIKNYQIVLTHSLGKFVTISVGIFLAGYILGFVASFKRNYELRGEFISLVSFQNGGYLPINIAFFLFPPGIREKFLVFTFLYLLGFNVIMWSIGSSFVFKGNMKKFKLKSFFIPPITSTIVSLVLIYIGFAKFIPSLVISPLKMIGETSFVLSAIILGCWLAKIKVKGLLERSFIIGKAAGLKLIVLPLFFFIAVVSFKIFSLLGLFIVLQAAMPSAVSLPIVANLNNADSEFVSQGVFFTHILSIFTIPLWLGLYLKISGFTF
ncbi:MAG: AEC family transporter [Candidatus Omnitrophica bacterium]|nr:AEC family transporter [Candidatus Omnitrophota bacterium]